MENPISEYEATWNLLRLIFRVLQVDFVLLLVKFISVSLGATSGFFGGLMDGIMIFLWIIFLLGIWFFSCPRCKKRFFWNWWSHNPLASKCINCKLPKYAKNG